MGRIVARFGKTPGQVEFETEGFKGPACKENLDKTVGQLGTTVSQTTTDDYYEDPETTREENKQSGI